MKDAPLDAVLRYSQLWHSFGTKLGEATDIPEAGWR